MGSPPPSGPVCRIILRRVFFREYVPPPSPRRPLSIPFASLFTQYDPIRNIMAGASGKKRPPRPPKKDPKNTTMGPNDADPLAEDLGDRAASLLPKEILGIDTRTFAYKVEQPESNPDLTVWALINALKGSTTKGQSAVDSTKVLGSILARLITY